LQPPAYHIANTTVVKSKAQDYTKTWSLALSLVLVNVIFHLVLWHFNSWNPIALFSIVSFCLIKKAYVNDKSKIYLSRKDNLIYEMLLEHLESFKYSPNKYISYSSFVKSKLLNNVDYQYSGSQLLNNRSIGFSICNATVRPVSDNDFDTPFFHGVLAKKNITNNLQGVIIIRPVLKLNKSDIPIIFKKLFNRYLPNNVQRVYTENQSFDKIFEIHTNAVNSWKQNINEVMLSQFIMLNEKLLEIMKNEKEADEHILFTEHNLLKKSPLEISIVNNRMFFGIKNMKLFLGNQKPNEPISMVQIQKSLDLVKLIHSLKLS